MRLIPFGAPIAPEPPEPVETVTTAGAFREALDARLREPMKPLTHPEVLGKLLPNEPVETVTSRLLRKAQERLHEATDEDYIRAAKSCAATSESPGVFGIPPLVSCEVTVCGIDLPDPITKQERGSDRI